jgi:hypothetical protein
MHKGEIAPRILAGIIPSMPNFLVRKPSTSLLIFSFPKTEIIEPIKTPKIQYGTI